MFNKQKFSYGIISQRPLVGVFVALDLGRGEILKPLLQQSHILPSLQLTRINQGVCHPYPLDLCLLTFFSDLADVHSDHRFIVACMYVCVTSFIYDIYTFTVPHKMWLDNGMRNCLPTSLQNSEM